MQRKLSKSVLSGFLLALAFPRWNLWPLAWIALVPLLQSLDEARNRKEKFLFGFTAGFVFFLLSVSWLRHVTVFGLFFIVAMQAAYWGIFGLLYSPGAPLFLLSALWTAVEFIRSEVPVWGFGWNLLGASQAPNLWVAQLASLGGVFSVSFLVFLSNAVVHSMVQKKVKERFQTGLFFAFLLIATVLFGWSRLQTFNPDRFFRVSVLQGNIPQALKWDASHREEILRIYLNLTELASYDAPELIVWPEAAYPGFFNTEPLAEKVRELARKIQIPILMGSPHREESRYYNSAYLLAPSPPPSPPSGGRGKGEGEARIIQRYDKIRLVPFGEYVPWKPIFGFLESYAYALGVSDFSPGKEFSVFRLPLTLTLSPEGRGEGEGVRFSTLICFEDTFPDLARKFVDRGAEFLAVMTNDAWFGRSSAPYQHLQASIFRAIENGVPVIRAANTGVSAFISVHGEVLGRVRNQEGKDTFIIGGMTYPVGLARGGTIYREGGWIFPYGCLAALVIMAFPRKEKKRNL